MTETFHDEDSDTFESTASYSKSKRNREGSEKNQSWDGFGPFKSPDSTCVSNPWYLECPDCHESCGSYETEEAAKRNRGKRAKRHKMEGGCIPAIPAPTPPLPAPSSSSSSSPSPSPPSSTCTAYSDAGLHQHLFEVYKRIGEISAVSKFNSPTGRIDRTNALPCLDSILEYVKTRSDTDKDFSSVIKSMTAESGKKDTEIKNLKLQIQQKSNRIEQMQKPPINGASTSASTEQAMQLASTKKELADAKAKIADIGRQLADSDKALARHQAAEEKRKVQAEAAAATATAAASSAPSNKSRKAPALHAVSAGDIDFARKMRELDHHVDTFFNMAKNEHSICEVICRAMDTFSNSPNVTSITKVQEKNGKRTQWGSREEFKTFCAQLRSVNRIARAARAETDGADSSTVNTILMPPPPTPPSPQHHMTTRYK